MAVVVAVAAGGGGEAGEEDEEGRPLHPSPLERAELVVDGDTVCSTSGRELFCVDAASGEELFSETLPGPAATPPALVGETLVVAAPGGPGRRGLYGYSLDGRQLWERTDLGVRGLYADTPVRPGLPVAGDVVAVPAGGPDREELVGIDGRSGQEVWRTLSEDGQSWQGPFGEVMTDGQRYYAVGMEMQPPESGSRPTITLVALDGASGAELWRANLDDATQAIDAVAPVADGSMVAFALREPNRVVVLDTATGAHQWTVPLTSELGSVAHIRGVTIVADGAELRGYDDEGTELWTASTPEIEHEVIERYGAKLDIEDGEVYAFRFHVSVIDPSDGTSRTLRRNVRPTDVAVAGDHLVIAGTRMEAVPLPD